MEKENEEVLETIYHNGTANGDTIISMLQEMQKAFGYLDKEAVTWMAKRSGIPPARYYGVITFYSQFHLTPRGRNIITACCGTVCHVKGAPRIIDRIRDDFGLKGESQTTKDMLFTLESVNCVGACSIAPVVMVNNTVYGKQTPDKMAKNLEAYKE